MGGSGCLGHDRCRGRPWPRVALDRWLDTHADLGLQGWDEGIPVWQTLAHVVNHGTQHRSEAAVIVTEAGRSPGDLDMIPFAQEIAAADGRGRP
jgi:uncharacterized damage-inducible protein DinB